MRTLCAAVLAALLPFVKSHSWVACTDYRGDVNYYEESKCFAYPRNWQTARASALTVDASGYHIGIDTGYNYMPSENAACQISMSNPVTAAYTSSYPMAIYEQGKTYCLAWPTKNHVAAVCTNQYIPDTSTQLFISNVNPTSDPTQSAFKLRNINDLNTCAGDKTSNACQLGKKKHVDGKIDCLAYQRAPRFCDNTDKALGTGCFQIPTNLATGTYVFQWYWEFNPGSPYSTCWDAYVVAAGTGRGQGGTTGTPNPNICDASCSNSNVCQNNALEFGAAPDSGTTTDDSLDTGTDGSGTISDPVLEGDSVCINDAPCALQTYQKDYMFPVKLKYSSSGDRVIIVDILRDDGNNVYTWFGKGTVEVKAGSSSVTVYPKFYSTASAGTNYLLRHWMVDSLVYYGDDGEPWTQELAKIDTPLTLGSSMCAESIPASVKCSYFQTSSTSAASSFAAPSALLAVLSLIQLWRLM